MILEYLELEQISSFSATVDIDIDIYMEFIDIYVLHKYAYKHMCIYTCTYVCNLLACTVLLSVVL